MELTQDHLLNRRVILSQPKTGYRAGSDAILLAAAVPALAGQTVLDAGAGVGAVALCLASRVENVTVRGLERQVELTELAADNATANDLADRVNVLLAFHGNRERSLSVSVDLEEGVIVVSVVEEDATVAELDLVFVIGVDGQVIISPTSVHLSPSSGASI